MSTPKLDDPAGGNVSSARKAADLAPPPRGAAPGTTTAAIREAARDVLRDWPNLCDHPEDCECSAARLWRLVNDREEWKR